MTLRPLSNPGECRTLRAMRTVVYPGSFDPITNGHLDVVQRAAKMFDRVILAVARNEGKQPLFSLEERKRLALSAVSGLGNVVVETFEGLLVDYVVRHGACAVVRGLRAVSDFEFEFQLALMNRKLNEQVETLFLTPKDTYTFVSSRIVKEIARLGGDVTSFVTPRVADRMAARFVAADAGTAAVEAAPTLPQIAPRTPI